jgi:hypothetical protein
VLNRKRGFAHMLASLGNNKGKERLSLPLYMAPRRCSPILKRRSEGGQGKARRAVTHGRNAEADPDHACIARSLECAPTGEQGPSDHGAHVPRPGRNGGGRGTGKPDAAAAWGGTGSLSIRRAQQPRASGKACALRPACSLYGLRRVGVNRALAPRPKRRTALCGIGTQARQAPGIGRLRQCGASRAPSAQSAVHCSPNLSTLPRRSERQPLRRCAAAPVASDGRNLAAVRK